MGKIAVELYTSKSGKSPVEEIINNYDPKQRTKILRQLQYLEEFGLTGNTKP